MQDRKGGTMERDEPALPPPEPEVPTKEYPEPEGSFSEAPREVMRGLRTLYG
jgi:hypothetical protein